jgi:Cu(I)/Ag(I) efflux system membrane fusion protein
MNSSCSSAVAGITVSIVAAVVFVTAHPGFGANNTGEQTIRLSDHDRVMASVETVSVEKRKLVHDLRAVGKVQYNETALATITSRVDGYVERLFVDYTGVQVKAGDHLVELYSPDLLLAQGELVIAMESARNRDTQEAIKHKMRRLGLMPEQIEEIVRTRKVPDLITLISPISGTVTEKMIVQKSAVKPGDILYRLANLESVWVYLDIYEYELPWVHYGQEVEVTTEALPGQKFSGRVWFINPVVTEESRTVKVLLNISNEGQRLKPGMFVSAVIRSQLLADGSPAPTGLEGKFSCPMHPSVIELAPGKCRICGMELVQIPGTPGAPVAEEDQLVLAVPASAVLDSGLRKLVYVERAKNQFASVEITTGPRADDWFPVLSGLKEGERVAVRGNFLLDSQFQISGLPSLFYEHGQVGVPGHQHAGSTPSGQESLATPTPAEHKH